MKELMHPFALEQRARERGYAVVCGVDEAGAGPLAGPVYAAAVVLPPDVEIAGLNDSKKLTEKKRERLYDEICAVAVDYAVATASVEEIDRLNILAARMLAMDRAIKALRVTPDLALIDGNRSSGIDCANETVVGGDAMSASIAAASILAKVSRDRYVVEVLAREYPQYAFERHKGYGTRLHYERLDEFGACEAHRRTFLKKWEARR